MRPPSNGAAADQLREKFPKLAQLMDESETERQIR